MEKQVITVNGKDYDISDLDDRELYLLKHIKSLREQLSEAQFKLEQLAASEKAFANSLVASLSKETSDEPSQ